MYGAGVTAPQAQATTTNACADHCGVFTPGEWGNRYFSPQKSEHNELQVVSKRKVDGMFKLNFNS